MKSEDLRNVVLSKLQNGQGPKAIARDLNGQVSTCTIKRWSKMVSQEGSLVLRVPPGRPRSVRTRTVVQRTKTLLRGKAKKSTRKLARKLQISRRSVQRILREDLGRKPYKIVREPRLSDEQKRKRVKFANWVRNNFTKAKTLRFVFSDDVFREKLFTVDGVYNRQNERIWAVSRAEADKNGGRRGFDKFPGKVMVFLAVSLDKTTFRKSSLFILQLKQLMSDFVGNLQVSTAFHGLLTDSFHFGNSP
jgi:transposase